MGISKKTLGFLQDLHANNEKEWFHANKQEYQEAKQDFTDFLLAVMEGIATFDHRVEPDASFAHIFRINRDIRFSKDKSPYKNNFGAEILIDGQRNGLPGYYMHIEPKNSAIAGGVYIPDNKVLEKVRRQIVENQDEFIDIIYDENFVEFFGELDMERTLKRMPRGFEEYEHTEVAKYLKLKSFTVWHSVSDTKLTSKEAEDLFIKGAKLMKPFIYFLREGIETY